MKAAPDDRLIQAIALVQDAAVPPDQFVASARLLFEESGGDMNDALLDENRARLALFGAGAAAVKGLENACEHDLPFAVACLLLIRNLARDQNESVKIVHQYNAAPIILRAMQQFGVAKEAAGTISNLSVSKPNRLALIEAGLADAVAAAVGNNLSESRVVEYGLCALANLALCPEANLLSVSPAVIAGMRAQAVGASRNHKVGESGARFFGTLATREDNRAALLQNGAAQVVIDTMSVQALVPGITEWGCRLLRLLSQNQPHVKQALVAMGAAPIICESLKASVSNSRVATQACATLWSLANLASNKPQLLRVGAVDVIVAALKANPTSLEVAISGCASLASIGNAGGGAKAALVRAGAAVAVMEAMSRYSHSIGVAVHGSTALWTMAIATSNKLILVEAGAHDALLAALKTHDRDVAVASKALGGLHSLSALPETCASMNSPDLITGVVNALKAHMERSDVAEHACGTLGNLAAHATDRMLFSSLGVPELAISVQRIHKDNTQCTAEADRLLDLLWSESVVV